MSTILKTKFQFHGENATPAGRFIFPDGKELTVTFHAFERWQDRAKDCGFVDSEAAFMALGSLLADSRRIKLRVIRGRNITVEEREAQGWMFIIDPATQCLITCYPKKR